MSRRRRQSSFPALSQSTAYTPLIASGNLGSSSKSPLDTDSMMFHKIELDGIMKHSTRSAGAQKVQLNRKEVVNAAGSDQPKTNLMKGARHPDGVRMDLVCLDRHSSRSVLQEIVARDKRFVARPSGLPRIVSS